ncbi:MAG: hypothetical protein R3B99_14970 [Polyangiales bacterium]|nr:hypothetical protein [Myxococcales bacterium]
MLRGAGVLLVALFFASPRASAECQYPRLHIAPTPEEKLPPNPVLRLFRYDDVPRDDFWASAPYVVTSSERFGVLTVDTLRFAIAEGELVVRGGEDEPQQYVVTSSWRRPEQRVVGGPAERIATGDACSFELGVLLTPRSFAPAFDVHWAGGHVLLPASRSQTVGVPRLLVGHHRCRGFVVDPAVQKRTTFRVTALFADGSRAEAGTFSVGGQSFEPPPTTVRRKALFVPNDGALQRLAACGALVMLALIAWGWRRRRAPRAA